MKVFWIILVLCMGISLFAQSKKDESKVIMLKVVAKGFTLDESSEAIFRSGVEEVLTENKYSLVSEEVQNETLKEQANQRKKECLDESCLVDTGKMLAARGLFVVEVIKAKESYLFKLKYINLETAETLKTKSLIYEKDIDDAKNLMDFAKDLAGKIIFDSKDEEKEEIKTEIKEIDKNGDFLTYENDKYSFIYPKSWEKDKKNIMWKASNGSSVNLITEKSSMKIPEYVKASLKNMKKSISSYVLISQETKTINDITATILYGKFNMYNNNLRIYSVIFDGGNTKYVLTLGGLDSSFDNDKKTFHKIINSFSLK